MSDVKKALRVTFSTTGQKKVLQDNAQVNQALQKTGKEAGKSLGGLTGVIEKMGGSMKGALSPIDKGFDGFKKLSGIIGGFGLVGGLAATAMGAIAAGAKLLADNSDAAAAGIAAIEAAVERAGRQSKIAAAELAKMAGGAEELDPASIRAAAKEQAAFTDATEDASKAMGLLYAEHARLSLVSEQLARHLGEVRENTDPRRAAALTSEIAKLQSRQARLLEGVDLHSAVEARRIATLERLRASRQAASDEASRQAAEELDLQQQLDAANQLVLDGIAKEDQARAQSQAAHAARVAASQALSRDLAAREIALFADANAAAMASLALRHAEELAAYRAQGVAVATLQEMQIRERAAAETAIRDAAGEAFAEEVRRAGELGSQRREMERAWEESRTEGLRLAAAQEEELAANFRQRLLEQVSLSEAAERGISAQVEGLDALSAAAEQWGASATLVEGAQMLARGIQSGADSIRYAAEAAASFATGNIVAGVGYTAASVGMAASAAAYAAGLAKLGQSSGGVPSAPSAAGSSGLSGTGSAGPQPINISLNLSGSAGSLGRLVAAELNAEAQVRGGARIDSRIVRR